MMTDDDKRAVVERYTDAYNTFDIDGMLSVIHPDVEFENISGGRVDASAHGLDEFRQLAGQSKQLFASRKQSVTSFRTEGDQASADIAYEGVLACDLPNGMKAGQVLRLKGRSEFTFRDGKLHRIADIS